MFSDRFGEFVISFLDLSSCLNPKSTLQLTLDIPWFSIERALFCFAEVYCQRSSPLFEYQVSYINVVLNSFSCKNGFRLIMIMPIGNLVASLVIFVTLNELVKKIRFIEYESTCLEPVFCSIGV